MRTKTPKFNQGDNVRVKESGSESVYKPAPKEMRGELGRVLSNGIATDASVIYTVGVDVEGCLEMEHVNEVWLEPA